MIKRITIENFKSLKKVDLKLGRMNIFIGTNASGKSNFFDALRLLRGIAGGFSVKDLLEGGVRTTSGEIWPGIRGGLANAIYLPSTSGQPQSHPSNEAKLGIELQGDFGDINYSLAFNRDGLTTNEKLARNGKEVFSYEKGDAFFKLDGNRLGEAYPSPVSGSQLIFALVTGFAGNYRELIVEWLRYLLGIQLLELAPQILRGYGTATRVFRMGEHGENFASLVRYICEDEKTKKAYLSWLRELRPQEVNDIKILTGAVGEPLFALNEGGREFPAPVLSDGTLRFSAVTAAFFQKEPSTEDAKNSKPLKLTAIGIEEIENGIHGTRLRLLVELLRTQAAMGETQVFATTHSPLVLDWLKPEEYKTTFLCKRDEGTGESKIYPLTEIPNFNEVVKKQSISELFAEGWMEAAI
jgi:predicted ATPase